MFWDNIQKKNSVEIIQKFVVFVRHFGSFCSIATYIS